MLFVHSKIPFDDDTKESNCFFESISFIIPNVHPGVVVWFSEKDTVIWVGIKAMEKMVNDGEKSIGLRMLFLDRNLNKMNKTEMKDIKWLLSSIVKTNKRILYDYITI